MVIEIVRTYRKAGYTVGNISIDGFKQPYNTMEPFDAGLDSVRDSVDAITKSKLIHGKVAIPTGMYPVTLQVSPHFKHIMPRVQNVPGFDGVLFHSGNTPLDTRGCILLGFNDSVGMLSNSRDAYMSFASSVLRAVLSHDVILLHIHEVVDSNDNHLHLNK
jgi:hypothetical protein